MKHYEFAISDYEHSGDLSWAKSYLLENFPKVKNVRAYEERDYEAEADYESEYDGCDEPIYKGYVSFDAPDEYIEQLKHFSL